MAPHPQAPTASAQPSQSSTPSQSTLPGIKRGIAIGVAASTCIILIALLAAFAVHRRKMLAARLAQAKRAAPTTPHIDEKRLPKSILKKPRSHNEYLPDVPTTPIDSDAQTIFELDGVSAELGAKDEEPRIQELDGASAPEYWELKTEKPDPRTSVVRQPTLRGGPLRLVPVLHVSPPEVSPLEERALMTEGTSPSAVSAGGISPLQEVYSPMTPRAPRGWI